MKTAHQENSARRLRQHVRYASQVAGLLMIRANVLCVRKARYRFLEITNVILVMRVRGSLENFRGRETALIAVQDISPTKSRMFASLALQGIFLLEVQALAKPVLLGRLPKRGLLHASLVSRVRSRARAESAVGIAKHPQQRNLEILSAASVMEKENTAKIQEAPHARLWGQDTSQTSAGLGHLLAKETSSVLEVPTDASRAPLETSVQRGQPTAVRAAQERHSVKFHEFAKLVLQDGTHRQERKVIA